MQANTFTARGTNQIHVQWRIQDFQGALTPEFGAKNHYMTTNFLPKTVQKKKKMDGGGGWRQGWALPQRPVANDVT